MFSQDISSQNIWHQFTKSSKTFMESLIANFIQFLSPLHIFLVWEGKLGIGLYLHSDVRPLTIFSFS